MAQVLCHPEGLSVPLSLKTAKLASLSFLLARGDFESPVCLDNWVQSSGKLTNQQRRGHNSRPNVHYNQGAVRLLSIALVKPLRIPFWTYFLLDSIVIYLMPADARHLA